MSHQPSPHNQNLYRIIAYSKNYWKQLVVSMLCASFFGIFSAAPSYIIQYTVDEVFVKRLDYLLIPFIVCFIGLFILKGIFMYLSAYYMNWVGFRVVNDLRADLFRRIIYYPTSFFKEKTTGKLIAHFLSDINLIQETASSAIRNGMRSFCEGIFLLGVAFMQSWKLSFIMIIIGPLVAFSIKKMGTTIRATSRLAQQEMGYVSSLLQETFSGIREIKAFNTEKIEVSRFLKSLNTYFSRIMKTIHFEALTPALIEIIAMSGIATILYIAAQEVLSGSMTPGQLTSFFAAILLAYQPLKRLINVYTDIQYGLGAADRIFEVIDLTYDYTTHRTKTMQPFTTSIVFQNVSFSYTAENMVLKNASLSISKGERIGIIGPSGSGKSTFCDLLLGFIQPLTGKILIDSQDITHLTFESLRKHIGYVGQHPFLFNDSIYANITYGLDHVEYEAVERASKIAHADEFIQKLSEKYQTTVGENGNKLSGGQKQRLTIARAVLKDPEILIFDEATSALDHVSEEMIRKALYELSQNKTVIIVSHRLTFLEEMDRIFTIKEGNFIEVTERSLKNTYH